MAKKNFTAIIWSVVKNVFLITAYTFFALILMVVYWSIITSFDFPLWLEILMNWLFGGVLFTVPVLMLQERKSASLLKKSVANSEEAVIAANKAVQSTERLSNKITKPRAPEDLKKKFFSTTSIYTYYIDYNRISSLYQQVVGLKQPQTLTEEKVTGLDGGFLVGFQGMFQADVKGSSTNKLSETSQYLDPSIDEKFLIVQYLLLQRELIALGYETSLYEIENEVNLGADYDYAEILQIDDYDKWVSKEVERLKRLYGYILIEAEFLVQSSDSPKEYYQLTFTRPIVQNTVLDHKVEFRISIARELINVNDQLYLSNYLNKRIKLRIFGYVAEQNNNENENERVIDIAPLVVYV